MYSTDIFQQSVAKNDQLAFFNILIVIINQTGLPTINGVKNFN